jgi:hypothetical protein
MLQPRPDLLVVHVESMAQLTAVKQLTRRTLTYSHTHRMYSVLGLCTEEHSVEAA